MVEDTQYPKRDCGLMRHRLCGVVRVVGSDAFGCRGYICLLHLSNPPQALEMKKVRLRASCELLKNMHLGLLGLPLVFFLLFFLLSTMMNSGILLRGD